MSEIKFPKTSYRPKQLFHQLHESDEFQEVVIVGVKKDGSVGWYYSQQDVGLFAIAQAIIQKMIMDGLQLIPKS